MLMLLEGSLRHWNIHHDLENGHSNYINRAKFDMYQHSEILFATEWIG
jgi:hypothetical protein